MSKVNLLSKTELWIDNVFLDQVNLEELAATMAGCLALEKKDVVVVDIREDHITFDILRNELDLEQIVGKESDILDALEKVSGFKRTEETRIHSDGVLGMLQIPKKDTEKLLQSSIGLSSDIFKNIQKRAVIFSTGFELLKGYIEDTNKKFITDYLSERGYKVKDGGTLPDNLGRLVFTLNEALDEGYGLIITTGGVGAEDKDHSIEALQKVIPNASTPYVVKYQVGGHRHVKDGVRIGVGKVGPSIILTLPGPNSEVRLLLPIAIEQIQKNIDVENIAADLASVLAKNYVK